jgi:hypothetical protein
MTMRNWLPALCAAVLALGTGCGKECVDAFDCVNDKGAAPSGQYYVCAESKCELRNLTEPEPEPTDGGDTTPDAGTDAGTDGGNNTGTDGGTDGGVLACTPACTSPQECDTTAGACVACVTDAHCAGVDATKPYCLNKAVCVQCRDNSGCGLGQVCNANNTCEVQQGPTAAATSAQIAAFLAAADGALTQAIEGAYVTYIKPKLPVGTEVGGFFLQAEPEGPAMFVAVDPATLSPALKVGDRVSLSVTKKTDITGVNAAETVTGVTRLSEGHPVKNQSTATPAGLAVDRSTVVADLQANVANYESELIFLSGTLASDPLNAGGGHTGFEINTTGATAPRLRLPTTLVEEFKLVKGCGFTLKAGPVWRFNTTAQPSAYALSDLNLDCPATVLVSASPGSLTQARLTFDRSIDAASITNAAQQFTFSNGLQATAATVNGRDVTVTTTAQTRATEYTVTVANTVKDVLGKPVAASTTPVSFVGFQNLVARGGRLLITGTGFTDATAVTLGGKTQAFVVDSNTQVTIASVDDATPVGVQPIVVTTPGGDVAAGEATVLSLLISELDADQPTVGGTNDASEFVEIATGVPNLKISGFALVLFNGSNDLSYQTINLNATTDANGLLVVGGPSVTNVTPGLSFPAANSLQNGVDAVAIYQAAATAFPNDSAITPNGLIDAVVYTASATATADDAGLLDALIAPGTDPRRVQVNENKNNRATSESIQRCTPERRDGRAFSKVGAPSPGAVNTCP